MNNETTDPLTQKLTLLQATVLVSGILIIVVLSLTAVHTFNVNAQKTLQRGLSPAQHISNLEAQNKALGAQNGLLTAKNTELMNEQSQFCGELSKAKIVEPLCVQ